MFPKKPAIIGRWRWRLSCLLAKAHQIPLAPTDRLHLNTGHSLLPPSPRHPQGATSCWIVVECREQDAEEVLTMTETAMLDGMKQLAKDRPVEVEGGICKTWGSTK